MSETKPKKNPAVMWYPTDFLHGTNWLTDKEFTQYTRIINFQHDQGKSKHFTMRQLKDICKGKVPEQAVLDKLVQDSNGRYYNQRMEDEIMKRKDYSEHMTMKAHKRWSGEKKEPEEEPKKEVKPRNVFTPPTVEQVQEYAASINFPINAERFIEYYSAEDWMIKGKRIASWKKCVVTWKNHDKDAVKAQQETGLKSKIKPTW